MRPVLAYHIVLTCYGFWLPNDPRGAWSEFVRAFELNRVGGPATKVDTKRSVAAAAHDIEARRVAKAALVRPSVIWDAAQLEAVTAGFADYARCNGRRVYAAAVLRDHAHLVVARCDITAEKLVEQFKARATAFLNRAGLHPFAGQTLGNGRTPSPWARHAWNVFLDSDEAIARAVRYVALNPERAGLPRQRHDWVVRYGG